MSAALEPDLRGELLAIVPHLRAFAVLLTGDRGRADDLVLATLTTAWGEFHHLGNGTNLRLWLFKVLRALCCDDTDSTGDSASATNDRLVEIALAWIPIEQREALLLVTWEGFSHEEAAEICRCSVYMIQHRLNAARRFCSAPN